MIKTGLFPGKFDPPTLGHLEIIERAAKLCAQLYVGVFDNKSGKACCFSAEERVELLLIACQEMRNVHIVPFSGLAVDCAASVSADCLIRGLRNGNDFIYEQQMACSNHALTGIETLFLSCSPQLMHLNATLVKEIASHGKCLTGFVPDTIERQVLAKLYQ
jgi:pantetheine-phosphate adenylyltransferase